MEVKMGQDELFFQANEFLENISGRDHLGIAKANLVIRIGGGESSHAITADLGPVVLEKRNMQECYMLTFQFEKQGALRQCYEQVEKYASYVDIVSGAVDDQHMMSFIIMENNDEKQGYAIAQNPVFFAQTASEALGTIDSYRLAFRKDCLFFFNNDDIPDEDVQQEEEPDSGFVRMENVNKPENHIWTGFS